MKAANTALLALAALLLGAAPALAQPDSLPLPARKRPFSKLGVTLTDYRGKESTLVVTADGKVAVDGRSGVLTATERAALQSAFEAYDDRYELTVGDPGDRGIAKLAQPPEDWYVPPISIALDVRIGKSRHVSTCTLPQLDRLDARRVEHALMRRLLDVRSRVLLEGLSATLTAKKPGAVSTTQSAEIAHVSSDGILSVETRTTRKRHGKLETQVHRTAQRLASPDEVELLRAAATNTGPTTCADAVVRLADGSTRAADPTLAAMLELERHGGPPINPGANSHGLASTLDRMKANCSK